MKKIMIYLVESTLILLMLCTYDSSEPLISEQMRAALISLNLGKSEICKIEGFDSIETHIISDRISAEEIKEKIDTILYDNAYREKVENRTEIQQGDLVIADLELLENEHVVLYMPEEPIRVGSGNYNSGLEQLLVGMDIRKPQIITWVVPEDFSRQEYAGKKLKMLINIQQLCQVKVPSIEEYLSSKGIYDKNEYVEIIKEELAEEKKNQQINEIIMQFYDKIIERSTFKMSNDEISENALSLFFEQIGYNDTLNMLKEDNWTNENDIYSKCCIESEKEIKRFLIDGVVANEWGIIISDDQINSYMLSNNIREISEREKSEIILLLVEEAIRSKYINDYIKSELSRCATACQG